MSDLLTHIGGDTALRDELIESWEIADLRFYNQTESTQDIVRALAEAGAPEWTVVVADNQTSGRGRNDGRWISHPGTSILLSFLLRPRQAEAIPLLSIRTGLVIARALDELLAGNGEGTTVRLKWPNDLVLDNGKVGGILVDGTTRGSSSYAVIGIGLNVFRFGGNFSSEATLPPAFLDDHMSARAERLRILDRLITTLRGSLRTQPEDLMPEEVAEYHKRDWLRGRLLREPIDGIAAGINRRGHLLIDNHDVGVISTPVGAVRLE